MKIRVFRAVMVLFLLGTMLACAAEKRMDALATSGKRSAEEEELERQRKNTQDEIDSLKSDISTVENRIRELQSSRSSLQTYIQKLDEQVNSLAAQMSALEERIEEKETEIEAKTEELEAAEAEAEEQYEMMKKRICYMYERGSQSVLELLLESESVADMLNRSEYAFQMLSYDREMMEKLDEIREAIEVQKAELESEKAEQEELLTELESQKTAVNRAISAKSQEIASYQSQINEASGQQSDYETQLAEQEKLLEQIEQQIAQAAAARAAAEDGDGGASGFVWPCPSSHRITSSFGPREAPIAGASTYHRGIDVGAASGSAIVAAVAGRVTTAAYSSSAGNYVVISHGQGVSTVYMHASALYVSEGDRVTQGQKIAAVGSTGYSTGPHLHFGVIVNGSYVNPLKYVN